MIIIRILQTSGNKFAKDSVIYTKRIKFSILEIRTRYKLFFFFFNTYLFISALGCEILFFFPLFFLSVEDNVCTFIGGTRFKFCSLTAGCYPIFIILF